MSKTIKQIADELKVSKQAVYKRYKNKLYTEVYPYTHTENNVLYIDEQGEKIIKQDFLKSYVDKQPHTESHTDTYTDTHTDTEGVHGIIDTLKTTIELLNKQLSQKDKQIEELTETIKIQAQSINAANHAELAEQLKIENSEDREKREKKGFFKRLFNRG
jgi:AcrR family transcriptional regulator